MTFPRDNRAPIDRSLTGVVKDIGASKTLRIELPVGLTYLDFEIEAKILGAGAYPGTAPTRVQLGSMWTRIRCYLDGELRYDVPMSEYIDWYSYHADRIGASGYLPLLMSMPWNMDPNTPAKPGADDLGAKINPAWGTKNHSSFVIEIDQDATSTIDYVGINPTLHPVSTDLGLHVRPVRLTHNLNTLGQSDWQVPFLEKGAFLYGIHLKPPTIANLTYARLQADGVTKMEGTLEKLHRLLTRPVYQPTVQTGWLHMDLHARHYDDDALPFSILDTPLNLQLTFANAAPGTFPVWLTVASPDTRAASAA